MHERHRRQRETDRRNCGDTRRSYHYNVRLKINRPRPRVAWNFIFIHSKIARKVAYSLYTPPSLHVFLGGGVTCTYYKSSRIIASPPAPTGCQSASEVFILKTAVLVWKCSTTTTPQKILQQFCVAVDSVQGRPRLRYASTGCICIAIMGADMRHQSDSADLRYLWAVGLPLPPALTDTRVLTYLLTHLQFKS